jgi:hypothetical protein
LQNLLIIFWQVSGRVLVKRIGHSPFYPTGLSYSRGGAGVCEKAQAHVRYLSLV